MTIPTTSTTSSVSAINPVAATRNRRARRSLAATLGLTVALLAPAHAAFAQTPGGPGGINSNPGCNFTHGCEGDDDIDDFQSPPPPGDGCGITHGCGPDDKTPPPGDDDPECNPILASCDLTSNDPGDGGDDPDGGDDTPSDDDTGVQGDQFDKPVVAHPTFTG
jgi:hypothetical protein